MEDGRRLENLSWRIWNRETFCCESQPQPTTMPEINLSGSRPRTADIPELSASVDSASSEEADRFESRQSSRTAPLKFRSSPLRGIEYVQGVSRGQEKPISSLRLEKMVLLIKEQQRVEPLSLSIADAVPTLIRSTNITPRPTSPTMHAPLRSSESSSSTAPLSSRGSEHSSRPTVGSDTSAELLSSHSVVRGFSPNQVSSLYRSHTHLAPAPIPTKSIHSKAEGSKKGGMFLIGGSSGDDDSSFDEQMSCQSTRQSSLTVALNLPLKNKKQTSFQDEVESRTINHKSHKDEEVFESDDEGDAPESAIEDDGEDDDDDDGSDWEDSVSDGAEAPANDKQLFQRVDSRPNITSRRSLLTTLMHQPDRAAAFADMASKSTSALQHSRASPSTRSSAGTSPEEEQDSGLAMLPPNMTRSKPIVMIPSDRHPPALSPRTTRRNMLATELTQSLRKHLLWERQQKSTTANAVLKRRHTAHDVANLQDYPGKRPGHTSQDSSKNNSWNHYFDHGLGEYHQTGW